MVLTDIKIKDDHGKEVTGFNTGDRMNIELYYESFNPDIREVNVFVGFLSCKDFSYVSEINTIEYIERNKAKTRSGAIRIEKRGVISVKIEPLLLLNNHYSLWVILYSKGLGHLYYSEYKNVKPFFVAKSTNPSLKGDAVCWLPASFEVD